MNYLRTIAALSFGAIAGFSAFRGICYAILGEWTNAAFSATAFVFICAIAIFTLAKINRSIRKIEAANTTKA